MIDPASGAVLFPFRTTAMLAGLLTIVVVSRLTQARCPALSLDRDLGGNLDGDLRGDLDGDLLTPTA